MPHIEKKHFEVLDGLRGIAALAVVVFHFMEVIIPESSHNPIGHGFLTPAVLLALAFLAPFSAWNIITESFIVLLYFPFLISLGAGATPSPRIRKFVVFSGKLSYPLYMTHYWLIWIFAEYLKAHQPQGAKLFAIVLGTLAVQLALAWLVMIAYDIPVRRAPSCRTQPR